MTGQIWTISSRECWKIESNWSLYFIHLVTDCQSVTGAGSFPPVRTQLYQHSFVWLLLEDRHGEGYMGGVVYIVEIIDIYIYSCQCHSEQQQISLMILWKSACVLFEAFMLMYNSFPCSDWGLSWEYFTITTHKTSHGLKPSQVPVKTGKQDWPYPRVLVTDIILH